MFVPEERGKLFGADLPPRRTQTVKLLTALCACTLILVQGNACARTYSTNFVLTENPLSEGSFNWLNSRRGTSRVAT